MRKNIIQYISNESSVRDWGTQSIEIFSTRLPLDLSKVLRRKYMDDRVIETVVDLVNNEMYDCLDDYLLHTDLVSQDEREIIVESLATYFKHLNENEMVTIKLNKKLANHLALMVKDITEQITGADDINHWNDINHQHFCETQDEMITQQGIFTAINELIKNQLKL